MQAVFYIFFYFILFYLFILLFYFWRKKLYSVQIAEQWYRIAVKTGMLCNNSRARQLHRIGSSGLDGLLHSALERGLQCFHSSQENKAFTIWWKVCSQSQRGSWLIWTAVPSPWPWLVQYHTNEDSESSQFGPKTLFLIGQIRATPVGQSWTAPIG